jgi:hypothetical protein
MIASRKEASGQAQARKATEGGQDLVEECLK